MRRRSGYLVCPILALVSALPTARATIAVRGTGDTVANPALRARTEETAGR